MAIKRAVPGTASVRIDASAKANESPEQAVTVPGGLYPMKARAFELDEYRLLRGWPTPVPPCDIRVISMVSADGEVITNRDDPVEITTNALVRWVSDPETYESGSLRWNPVVNRTGQPVWWQTSVNYAPVMINDYEYRIGDERFYRSAFNFDSDSRNHFWGDFSTTIGGASGFTVIMVLSPNSTFGNNVDIPFNGLLCPGGPPPGSETTFAEDPGDSWFSLTTQGRYLWLETEVTARTRTVSINPGLDVNSPIMVAASLGRPESTIYVGNGPSSMRSMSIPTGSEPKAMGNSLVLGRSTGDVLHTADMALLDVGIYANQLTPQQVTDEFALLSTSYGGDR